MTVVVIAFGLLGMTGLQMRMQTSEIEAYQRTQALLLLNDMGNRLATNRSSANSYVTTASSPLGSGMTCSTTTTSSTLAQRDTSEWCNALQGASETTGANAAKVGAMIGGRGCVEKVGSDYLITVAWQGMTPIAAPPASVACAKDSYNGATGSSCKDDLCRRAVTTLVRIATL